MESVNRSIPPSNTIQLRVVASSEGNIPTYPAPTQQMLRIGARGASSPELEALDRLWYRESISNPSAMLSKVLRGPRRGLKVKLPSGDVGAVDA